ncbi:hypothetical protein AXK11_01405 [Cephaloticoccus primus]|uniref:Uncharacterized protein n=1 Tax=Cephaloticoccus primus TaxID=1548207 RepID=A0A139SUK7_9BACT|nr:hypothetical protein [Cephaloticoccus primus]KXU38120.1 hypothetical protein AXK11_01405 [Cephaloticoccus primus]
MFPNLLRLSSRTPPPPEADLNFVIEVNAQHKRPPNPRTERFILGCWILIALKHAAVIYACHHWPMPFHQLWINAPTFALGLLATVVYYWRRRR